MMLLLPFMVRVTLYRKPYTVRQNRGFSLLIGEEKEASPSHASTRCFLIYNTFLVQIKQVLIDHHVLSQCSVPCVNVLFAEWGVSLSKHNRQFSGPLIGQLFTILASDWSSVSMPRAQTTSVTTSCWGKIVNCFLSARSYLDVKSLSKSRRAILVSC